jgi:FAD-dependent oxidoreductase domain-containing protein 1
MRVLIVGGGVIGSAIACFLARDHGVRATVLERDPSHARASSALSASAIRQQFSTPANIALSQWSLGFLRRVGDELSVGDERPHIGLVEAGYLYLADAAGAGTLRANHAVQRAAGADVLLLDPARLSERFPWLAIEGLALGALGLSGEGWFDGPALMQAFRRKATACGARFVAAEAVGFEVSGGERVRAVLCGDGRRFDCDALVLTAGAWSAPRAARRGVALPVSARKRDVFVLDSPARLPRCPLVIDPRGVWFRPEGRGFIAGAPPRGADEDGAPLDEIDHGLFDEVIWPVLAARVSAFEAVRVRSAWAGYYEMNDFDHNALVGVWPGWRDLYVACGFSGHGMQHASAVGCAMAALIAGDACGAPAIDAFSPRRLAEGRPLAERNVI